MAEEYPLTAVWSVFIFRGKLARGHRKNGDEAKHGRNAAHGDPLIGRFADGYRHQAM
jgi:hypothetical protein